ncbi:MAG TPA: S8 family serine peptidase [Planctomycetota bacterium]|nr:S8 family serine peptidase [Planctomycetota bacterium]
MSTSSATPVSTLACSLLFLGAASSASAQEPAAFRPDRIVVELAASLPELPETLDLSTAFGTDPALRSALSGAHARSMFRVFRSGGVKPRDPALFHELGMHRQYVIDFAPGTDLAKTQRALSEAPSVVSTRLDGIVHTTETPNDPLFANQWDHRNVNDADMDTDFMWEVGKSNPSVIVAVIDTGCDLVHPEIASALVPGWNFVAGNNNPQDDHGHGTACAGIVGARSNNGLAIAGTAPNCSLMPIKVLSASGSGTYADVAAGITFAANNGASVISMSLGGPCCDAAVDIAMQYAASQDVLTIAASGNSNVQGVIYPASSPWGMAIGASSPCDERKSSISCDGESWWGSNYGPEVDVIAPGVQIATITLGGGTTLSFNGTSSATPHVAGIAAVVRAIDPTLTYAAVRALLQSTAEDQVGPASEDTPGFDIYFGFGRVNAHRAALAALGSTTFCFADGSGAPAPCGNTGGFDVGARNSTGSGALLVARGTNRIGVDDLVLSGMQLPANKPTLVLMGAGVASSGLGTPFYDGLLCISAGGIGIFRHAPLISSAGGTVVLGPGISAYSCSHFAGQACFQPGARWNFQIWFRDQAGPCASGANLSNGLGVTFRP